MQVYRATHWHSVYHTLVEPCLLPAVEGDENEVSGMEISKTHSTWDYYEVQGSNYLVQPSVIRPTPGKSYLLAFFRDRR